MRAARLHELGGVPQVDDLDSPEGANVVAVSAAALLGIASTFNVFGGLIDRFGWQAAFLVSATATALVAIVWTRYGANSPQEHGGVTGIAILLKVNDPGAHDRFWTHAMQYERVGEGRYRCGDSLIVVAEQGKVEHRGGQWRGPGYRYTTVQVWDCITEYEGILARGGASGAAPRVLGETVRYAFVCDPDGNHIEISQRASLTGGRL